MIIIYINIFKHDQQHNTHPNMVLFNILGYKKPSMCSPSEVLPSLRMTTAMSSSTRHPVSDKLQQNYNGVLLHISFNLGQKHQEHLRSYFNQLIAVNVTDTLEILRSLEYKRKISWSDVNLVKEAMGDIGRLDIVKELTEFEIKRDLTLLLDFYARKILGLELDCCSVSVKKVAGHLARLMEIVRGIIDIKPISSTVESSKDIQELLVNFEEEIDCREPNFSWNEFTMLVIIAGEIIAGAAKSDEQLVTKLCFTAADELCSRMTELGSWVS